MKNQEKSQTKHIGFEKLLLQLSNHRYDIADIFDDFMQWVILGFCVDGSAESSFLSKYKEKEINMFHDLFDELATELQSHLGTNYEEVRCYDILGSIFEDYVTSRSRKDFRGQFFTPEHICKLMGLMTMDGDKEGRLTDIACGSGRMLLAGYELSKGQAICFGSDIDKTCCLMTICNFLFHGITGEVVHQNTIINNYFDGWAINANIRNPFSKYFGVPHIIRISQENSYIWNKTNQIFKNAITEKNNTEKNKVTNKFYTQEITTKNIETQAVLF